MASRSGTKGSSIVNELPMNFVPIIFSALLVMGVPPPAHSGAQPSQQRLSIGATTDKTEMPLSIYPAKGRDLIVWLPSENGLLPADARIATQLAAAGYEIWMADALGARFLPVVTSSLEKIPAADIADIVRSAQAKTGKNVFLLGPGRGAVPALNAAKLLQADKTKALHGIILISPNLYVATPDAGEEAKYLPIAAQARSNIYILQPELSPWRWYLDRLGAELKKGGSRVQIKKLAGVRDRFYYREDGLPVEQAMSKRMPQLIAHALKDLEP